MKFMLILFSTSLGVEILLHLVPVFWRARKLIAAFGFLLTLVASVGMLAVNPIGFTLLFALAGLYRTFNFARVIKGRMHERYLRLSTRRTGFVLAGLQLLLLAGWWQWHDGLVQRHTLWLALAVLQAAVGLILLVSTARNLRRSRPWLARKHFSDVQLPSITIAIPARNETQDLEECLISIIANDYPKFEVLVLDDCSQNKRTPEIIRSFAHEGVRFIAGDVPKDTWLPKNQAYDQLVREASGEYILFCGVDVRFEPDTIRKIVTVMLAKQKEMMSILPHRADVAIESFSLLQAMRYWWELVPPRRQFRRPPVIGSSWIITAKALHATGGFRAVSRAIVPEAYFARQLIAHDKYSFVRDDGSLGISSVKAAADQRNTALRVRYPQLHRRPELVYIVSVLEVLFLALPFAVAMAGTWLPVSALTQFFATVAAGFLAVSYLQMAMATRINKWWFALIALPFVVAADLAWLHRSMWQYEFAEVEWKGRNVCVPVMHTYPHLPDAR